MRSEPVDGTVPQRTPQGPPPSTAAFTPCVGVEALAAVVREDGTRLLLEDPRALNDALDTLPDTDLDRFPELRVARALLAAHAAPHAAHASAVPAVPLDAVPDANLDSHLLERTVFFRLHGDVTAAAGFADRLRSRLRQPGHRPPGAPAPHPRADRPGCIAGR